jgi:hypothetical protein
MGDVDENYIYFQGMSYIYVYIYLVEYVIIKWLGYSTGYGV